MLPLISTLPCSLQFQHYHVSSNFNTTMFAPTSRQTSGICRLWVVTCCLSSQRLIRCERIPQSAQSFSLDHFPKQARVPLKQLTTVINRQTRVPLKKFNNSNCLIINRLWRKNTAECHGFIQGYDCIRVQHSTCFLEGY